MDHRMGRVDLCEEDIESCIKSVVVQFLRARLKVQNLQLVDDILSR